METSDLAQFLGVVREIVRSEKVAPPLTTIFAIHHDLVTFGVDAKYLTPVNYRIYFSPTTSCTLLKQSNVLAGDEQVQGFSCDEAHLGSGDLPGQHLYSAPLAGAQTPQ